MHQVELEILFCLIPWHPKTIQNSIQGSIRHAAFFLGHPRVFARVSELSVDCNLEALYLSVLDFEYRTWKTIKFCVGLYKLIIFKKMLWRCFIRYNGYLSVITDIIRIYNGLKKSGHSILGRGWNPLQHPTLTFK